MDKENGNYDFQIGTKRLLDICKTTDLSEYIQKQQLKYCAHLIRKPNSALNKQLLFNDDDNHKLGKKVPNLVDDVEENLGLTGFRDQFLKDCFDRKF